MPIVTVLRQEPGLVGLRRKFLANSDSCVLVYSFQGFQRNPTRRLHLSKRIYLVFMIDCCILHSTLNFSPSIVDSIHNPNWLYNKTPNRQIFFHLTLECQSKQSSGPPWILRFTVTKSFPSLDEDPPTVNVSAETIKARVAAGLILPPSPLIFPHSWLALVIVRSRDFGSSALLNVCRK